MKPSSCIVLRPIGFLFIVMIVVLSLAGLLIPFWTKTVTRIKNEVKSIAHKTNQELLSRIQKTTILFSPINTSAIKLERILSSSLDVDDLHLSIIESKVASILFQSLSTIPYLSQISYIGLDGIFFGYYIERDKLYALYSNSTFSSTQKNDSWYIQPANRDTGRLYGEAIKSPACSILNSRWFHEALNSSNGHASLGPGWGTSRDILFLSTIGMSGKKGAVSLGFSMKLLVDYLVDEIAFYKGSLCLATTDGNNVLIQGIPNTRMVLAGNRVSFQLLGHGEKQVTRIVGNITCHSDKYNAAFEDSVLDIWSRKYVLNCSTVEIAGLEMVYVLALPQNEFLNLIHKNIRMTFILLVLMIGAMGITICSFVYLSVEAAKREMYLCGALINQMEATQQSERKSMNKSLAFANASHDIRASLAGITGLLEMCQNEVSRKDPSLRSEMFTNLQQMEACTKDLLGILNSILDTSKIESGKMQLEEEEFDVQQLLEDVVELFHPVGNKKGVDVILDPYDGSVMKNSCVKGDRGKLKQILSNLLSNAVKFTLEGHVIVRAWTRKSSFINASSQNNSISYLFCWLFNIEKANSEAEVTSTSIQRDPSRMEFVFEVIDTGKGIAKEKQKSVFENYVQVKETALEHEGTGLGLGIVQSLVRLMGGEIGIVDKELDERGTCFRFNMFFSMCVTTNSTNNTRALDIEANNGDHISSDSFQQSGPIITRIQSPKTAGSQVLLFMQNAERSNILQKFMQRFGIKVHIVKQHEHLSKTLKKIKQKLNLSHLSSSGNSRSERQGSRGSSTRSKEVPLSALDGTDDILPSQKSTNARCGLLGFVMIVIDTRAGPFREISRAVAEFRRDLNENCYSRVVWLYKSEMGNSNFQGLDEGKLPPSDLVISKPFHGTRLYQVMGLLPEFGSLRPTRGETSHNAEKVEPRDIGCSETNSSYVVSMSGKSSFVCQKGEIEEVGGPNSRKPLMGKKILIADDDPIGRKIATFVVSQLGADVSSCENGEKAWKLVCKGLEDETKNAGPSKNSVPFDCILMDCEMPMMNGIEATRRIREVGEIYGVHIPIIALTAHIRGQEMDRMIQAGVDGCLTKPLNKGNLLKVVSDLSVKV